MYSFAELLILQKSMVGLFFVRKSNTMKNLSLHPIHWHSIVLFADWLSQLKVYLTSSDQTFVINNKNHFLPNKVATILYIVLNICCH